MAYKNAREVLPEALLRQIWKYVEGENIYIPKRQESRAAWGSHTGAREEYEARNEQIRRRYRSRVRHMMERIVGVRHYNPAFKIRKSEKTS